MERVEVLMRHLLPGPRGQGVCTAPTSATSSKFKYTVDNNLLTEEQRQFYEDNGYLVIKNLVSQVEIDQYRDQFKKVCEGEILPPASMTMMRDVAIAKKKEMGEQYFTKFQDFQDDEVLFKYCQHQRLLDYVECFTGPNIKAMHTMLINKPPDPGTLSSRHPLHQDLHYFPFRPADRIVCTWTAMQPINRQNGCLVVLPGSHKGELLPHGYPEWDGKVNKAYHGIIGLGADERRVHLEMDTGDTVFFHPVLIHGSGANRTNGFRKSISCHFSSTDGHYIDTKGSLQEDIAKEVENMGKKRTGMDIPFQDIWRLKSRLVRGQPGNL